MEVRVSLEDQAHGIHIDLAELTENARCHSKRELMRLIERRQEELIYELCGPRYSRGHTYRRGGSYTKTLITGLGMVRFRVKRVIRRIDDKVRSPILEALDAKRRRYSRDVRMKCVEFASKLSYGDASTEFETATGVYVPKRTIHSFVQQIAPRLLELNRTAAKAGLVIGDSTKVRGLASREMNNVRVLISGGGRMLALEVNEEWPTVEAGVLVSDGETGLIGAVKAERRQLCILHAIKYLLFTLWKEGMSKEERDEAAGAIKQTLFTLVNSTRKHLEDGDEERLQARIDWTLRELHEMARELRERGYPKAAALVTKHARFMVTFAELALEGVEIPYTTNRIERLMGEVSKRCKHRWMHWSTRGLKNILSLVLVRYTNELLYTAFKNAYIHNEAFIRCPQHNPILQLHNTNTLTRCEDLGLLSFSPSCTGQWRPR